MNDSVYLDLAFIDETWLISPPMPRWVAEAACFDFSQGVPWLNGKTVIRALLVLYVGPLH